MYSSFMIFQDQCQVCTDLVVKKLGTLHGVFDVEMDSIDGRVIVLHNEELTHDEIAETLSLLSSYVRIENENPTDHSSVG